MNKKGHFNNELAFGVELEILIPRDVSRDTIIMALNQHNIECHEEAYGHDTVEYWKMTTDCTVKPLSFSYNYYGENELVSPKLYGWAGKMELKKVLEILNEFGCIVNKTCGTHVHHDVTDMMLKSKEVVNTFLNTLVKTVIKYEHIIYRLIAPSRLKKIGTGYWTIPARVIFGKRTYAELLTVKNISKTIEDNLRDDCDRKYQNNGPGVGTGTTPYSTQQNRYSGLNLKNIWTRGSVEFRYHQGTLNFEKLWSWIVFTQSFIIVSKENNRVNFSNVQDGKGGLFHLRKAVGFIGSKDRCDEVKFANKVIVKRFEELTTSEMNISRRSTKYYATIKEQLQRGV
tara:strand:+ start:4681 stop:5706 length:1026 start_codon:yes stop_codon:yes gene_type:complete